MTRSRRTARDTCGAVGLRSAISWAAAMMVRLSALSLLLLFALAAGKADGSRLSKAVKDRL